MSLVQTTKTHTRLRENQYETGRVCKARRKRERDVATNPGMNVQLGRWNLGRLRDFADLQGPLDDYTATYMQPGYTLDRSAAHQRTYTTQNLQVNVHVFGMWRNPRERRRTRKVFNDLHHVFLSPSLSFTPLLSLSHTAHTEPLKADNHLFLNFCQKKQCLKILNQFKWSVKTCHIMALEFFNNKIYFILFLFFLNKSTKQATKCRLSRDSRALGEAFAFTWIGKTQKQNS